MRLHCHSGPNAALATGSGDASPTDSTVTTQPATASAPTRAIPFQVHSLWTISSFPFGGIFDFFDCIDPERKSALEETRRVDAAVCPSPVAP